MPLLGFNFDNETSRGDALENIPIDGVAALPHVHHVDAEDEKNPYASEVTGKLEKTYKTVGPCPTRSILACFGSVCRHSLMAAQRSFKYTDALRFFPNDIRILEPILKISCLGPPSPSPMASTQSPIRNHPRRFLHLLTSVTAQGRCL